jgi:hypothetical protein
VGEEVIVNVSRWKEWWVRLRLPSVYTGRGWFFFFFSININIWLPPCIQNLQDISRLYVCELQKGWSESVSWPSSIRCLLLAVFTIGK